MNTPPIRTAMEKDERGCPACGKPVDVSGLSGHCLMIDETGEYRYAHTLCGVNHHTEGKKRRAKVMCATCGLPLVGDHMDVGGEVFKAAQIRLAAPEGYEVPDDASYYVGGFAQCRNGGLFKIAEQAEQLPTSHSLLRKSA
jgi:endogenous inhibitor of DNA gyrase (YacG/DUF329 family)